MVMVMMVVLVMKIGYNLEYGGRGLRLGVWQTWVIIRSMAGLGLGLGRGLGVWRTPVMVRSNKTKTNF